MRFGTHYRKHGEGVWFVNAMEWQKREVLHFHSLIGGGISHLDRFSWMELWNRDNGFARIYPYAPTGAPGYVSKYVVKGGEIDIYLPPLKEQQARFHQPAQIPLQFALPG